MKSKTNRTSKNTSEQIKRDLLSLVSHELRTPLSSVLNAIRILRDGTLPEADRQTFLEMAYRNAETLNEKLSQILDLSKLVSGRLVCRLEEVSLRNLLIRKLQRLEAEAAAAGRSIETEVDTKALSALPIILGDSLRLEQVFDAVVDNAIKFSPAGTGIQVRVKKEQAESIAVELENAVATKTGGAGAKKTPDPREVFSQEEGVLVRSHEGVGGSLAIAAEVLRQHGGELHVERLNNGRRGPRFLARIVLPLLHDEAAVTKVLESRMYAMKTGIGSLSMLLIELGPEARAALELVHDAFNAKLFRASDAVYMLPARGQLAVIMDDCRKRDAPVIARRLLNAVAQEFETRGKLLDGSRVGLASFPDDGTDPKVLLSKAQQSLVAVREL